MDPLDLVDALRELASVPSEAEMEKARAYLAELIRRYDTEPEFRARVDEAIAECERDWPDERIRKDPGNDIECVPACNNNPSMDGFYPCNWNGDEVEPTCVGAWKGRLLVCASCGRIIDQETLRVVGRREV
jgi:hypothetical protein